jgi:hypothetical protein
MQKTSELGATIRLSASPIRLTYYRQVPCRVKPIEILSTQSAPKYKSDKRGPAGPETPESSNRIPIWSGAVRPGLSSVNYSALRFLQYQSPDLKTYRARPEDR